MVQQQSLCIFDRCTDVLGEKTQRKFHVGHGILTADVHAIIQYVYAAEQERKQKAHKYRQKLAEQAAGFHIAHHLTFLSAVYIS